MKKIYFTIFAAAISVASFAQVSFTNGNLVVYRVGDGAAALSNAASALFLDEYTTAGVLVQSVPLSGSANPITGSGTATSEGQITRSTDKAYILVPGYSAAIGTAAIAATTSAAANRGVAIVDKSATIDFTTKLTDAYSANNIRGAFSTNGSDLWIAGNSSSTGGVRYCVKGGTTSTQLATAPTNTRVVNAFNDQLYITAATGTTYGILSVGTGLPTTSGQTATLFNGFPIASGPSSYGFSINAAGNIAYVADDRNKTAGGGVQKWTFDGTIWKLAYTLDSSITTATSSARGLAVDWSTTNPTIYATTSSTIVKVVDVDSTSEFTTIVTAATNTGLRGLAFAPEVNPSPVKLVGFGVQKSNNNVAITWSTEQELNNKSFIIQRSANSATWTDLVTVAAVGNSSITTNYSSSDNNPLNGFNYYRLKQVNDDGTYNFSAIKKLFFSNNYKVMIAPNPANDYINVYISKNDINSNTSIKVSDINGKIVRSMSSTLSTVNISTTGLGKGIYFVKVANGTHVSTQKITVQ